MSNLRQLIDSISAKLQGFTRDQDQQTYLTAPIDSDDTSLTVNEPKLITQGIVEIEEELMWIQRVDNASGTVTVAPFGRGYLSTTAASHTANTAIMNNPKYPKSQIHAAIDDAVDSVFPDLYVLNNYEFTFVSARQTYEVPSTVQQIHRVTWETIGPSRTWLPLTAWRFDPQANTTRFPSGRTVDIPQVPIPGRTVRVTYMTPPTKFTDYTTDFATATGMNSTAEDVILYGACYRLVGFQESPRLQIQSIETQQRSQLVPPGATQNAARHFYQLYQLALQSERERLFRRDAGQAHFGRVG